MSISTPVRSQCCSWPSVGGSEKPKSGGGAYVYKSTKEGGDQIEFEDEDPKIHREFEEAVERSRKRNARWVVSIRGVRQSPEQGTIK